MEFSNVFRKVDFLNTSELTFFFGLDFFSVQFTAEIFPIKIEQSFGNSVKWKKIEKNFFPSFNEIFQKNCELCMN